MGIARLKFRRLLDLSIQCRHEPRARKESLTSKPSADANQIRKGQTLNSGELPQFTDLWYVTANDCEVVLRVFPDMSLGETDNGEISLDDSDALLSLNINSDGLLEVCVLSGELESEDGAFHGNRRLAFESAGLIKLPNNTLRLDKDILGGGEVDESLLPCAIWRRTGGATYTPALDSVDTSQPTPALDLPALEANLSSLPEPSAAALNDSEFSVSAIKEQATQQKLPLSGKAPSSHKRRQNFFAAASAAVVLVCIWLVYPGVRSDVTAPQSAPVAEGIVSRQSEDQAVIEQAPTVELPSHDQIGDQSKIAAAPIALPAIATSQTTVEIAAPLNELMVDDLISGPALVEAKPLPQNLPTPDIAEREALRNRVATSENTGSQPINPSPQNSREVAVADQAVEVAVQEAAVQEVAVQEETVAAAVEQAPGKAVTTIEVAETEPPGEQEQTQTALLTFERDLLAAELALAQGRLTHPPENSAYTLYKQLVASHPESSAARRGFQALGPALVNRAFAEVAAKRWSDAQVTLAAAAEVGASPSLVADLSRDVDYQQRLAEAEAGRFDTLYPEAKLVALNRTTPRLRRYAPVGMNKVQIEFTISVAGNVQDIEVLDAPPQQLERVVRQAVTDWRFEPVLSGTRPIPVRTRIGLEIP